MARSLPLIVTMSRDTTHNLATQLLHAGRRWGARPFVVGAFGATSFDDMTARASDYATAFRAHGVAPFARVGIYLAPGAEAVAAFFGALSLGAIPCLINPLYTPRQLAHVLADAEPRVLVADVEAFLARAAMVAHGPTLLDPRRIAGAGTPLVVTPVEPDTPALITYTSGSTGNARGVLASHGNLTVTAQVVAGYLGLGPDDRIGSVLPLSSVYGLSQVLASLASGAALHVVDAVLARDLLATLRAARVTVLPALPALWHALLEVPAEEGGLPTLRVMTNAGGHLPTSAVRALRDRWPAARLFLMYGMTEVFRSTFLDPALVDAHPDAIGRPVPGTDVLVLHPDGSPCAPGEVGELVHVGPTVALGYWRLPAETARTFREVPAAAGALAGRRGVFSGDLGRRDDEGLLYFVGRRDHMIKTLGYRVSPEEVADAVRATGLVAEVAVTGAPDARRGQCIVAHVRLRSGATVTELTRAVRAELPPYMRPASYRTYERLPRTAAGKVDYGRLILPVERAVRLPLSTERTAAPRRAPAPGITADAPAPPRRG